MNRRNAIKRVSLGLGFAASSSAVVSLLNGCTAKKELGWKPVYFNEEEANLVSDLVDIILPKTDSPGALELGVDAFIDHMVGTCYDNHDQQTFKKGLASIDEESNLIDGQVFLNMSSEKKSQVLTSFESKAGQVEINQEHKPFFSQLKELTLLGYFTSEEIMKNHMEYVPIPTKLEGCNDMKPGQKLIVGNHL